MLGNALQWTQDFWNDSYHGAPTNGATWTAGDCAWRVVRGGSWGFVPRSDRAAFRFGSASPVKYLQLGFRLARTD
jgi:formylglycine-generating enzyme required for sulfatase activity